MMSWLCGAGCGRPLRDGKSGAGNGWCRPGLCVQLLIALSAAGLLLINRRFASSDMLKHIDGDLLLTPDVQYINDPAKDTVHDNVWALSSRGTMLF
jgi:hypothetical protein